MYSTLPSQCSICSTLRGNLTKEVLLQIRDHWETHYLGLICPGTTFFAGSLPGWWDFTAELKQHNFNTKVGLHALALVWKGGQLWKCLSGESIPSNCFLCVLTNCEIVHIGWQNLLCYHQTQKYFFFFSGRARFDLPPGEGAGACQVDWGDGERSCSCSICSSDPGGMNTNNLVVSMKKWTKWMFFDDDMKEI